jgi:hypothetical protein
MNIVLKIHLNINGTRCLYQDGYVKVYKEENIIPHAYNWIRKIWIENGCQDLKIEKVIWNEENDITEEVKRFQPVVIDDLPF